MKWIVIVAFFTLFANSVSAQAVRLKRKYLKEYQGEMPKFNALIGKDLLEVTPAKLIVKLDKDSLFLSIGNSNYEGIYSATKSANTDEVLLLMERDNTQIAERFILNKKNKTIVRKGIFPQPDVCLNRSKKSGKR
jgi:predicted GNAT superfamily acetyltransferase